MNAQRLTSRRTLDDYHRNHNLLFSLHSLGSQSHFVDNYSVTLRSISSDTKITKDVARRRILLWVGKDEKHENEDNIISLTFDLLFVFWEWKRRGSYNNSEVIVIKSSELNWSEPERVTLGTKILRGDEETLEYRFAKGKTILDKITIHDIDDLIPSWIENALNNAKF
ncbi:hypothetical protein B0F90DRAFT_1819684 [Multifurca ochricompacta]|uniref:Uncharacterized protein n=1 Tax=Multifurca ochricompacta TaxID=376703 RepID=A0AAD4M0C5_9AGAM|nr:hypothetical protein B0F90DRAFT_1819684 [Multifurca ochricompacta]